MVNKATIGFVVLTVLLYVIISIPERFFNIFPLFKQLTFAFWLIVLLIIIDKFVNRKEQTSKY